MTVAPSLRLSFYEIDRDLGRGSYSSIRLYEVLVKTNTERLATAIAVGYETRRGIIIGRY